MSTIGISGVQTALAEFIDQRILPAVSDDNSMLKWMIGGASTVFLSRFDRVVNEHSAALSSIGIIDESGNLDVDATEKFVNSAFEKQTVVKMPILGVPFTFDKADGDALIAILKRKSGD
jgi:hypothetical protein